MSIEILCSDDTLVIRRMTLAPGEAGDWHVDRCRRFSVIVRGDRLRIEYAHAGEVVELDVHPGLCGWDDPEERVHRAVNIGRGPYEEVVTFHRTGPDVDPQPAVASADG